MFLLAACGGGGNNSALTESADDPADLPIVVNNPPSVEITGPEQNGSFSAGALIQFTANAEDAEDGPLSASIEWTSDLEGSSPIGNGGSFSTSTLQSGTHVVTASVADSSLSIAADAVTVIVQSADTSEPSLPNVLFFLSDDVGWGDPGIYNLQSKIPTPNIDRLAAEGMRFTDAHSAAAKCAPTRYTALTGNYQWRGLRPWGVWNYKGVGRQILPGQWTLGNILQNKGYNTAFIGKGHLGGNFYRKNSDDLATYGDPDDVVDFSRPMLDGPLEYGFNVVYMLLRGIQGSPYAFFRGDLLEGDPTTLIHWEEGRYNGSQINDAGIGIPDWDSRQIGPRLAEEAIAFIDNHYQKQLEAGTQEPFFLYYSSQSAHAPFTPPATLLGEPVDNVANVNSSHADMIYEVDVALGKLIEALETRDLINDTLIIFTSDNGGNPSSNEREQGHDAVGGLRSRKGYIWEGGHRVPLIVKWGDGTAAGSQIPPGSIRHQLIGVHDIIATVAAAVDHPLPLTQAVDSFNMLPVWRGETDDATPVRDHIIMQADRGEEIWAYREDNWKLVMDENFAVTDLYNLAVDLAETVNLAADVAQASRIADMHQHFLERRSAERTAPEI